MTELGSLEIPTQAKIGLEWATLISTLSRAARYNLADGQRPLYLVVEPDRASTGARRALPVDPGHRRFRPRSGREQAVLPGTIGFRTHHRTTPSHRRTLDRSG